MWKNYNKYRVLRLFFDDPVPKNGFHLREISRMAGISPKSVSVYLKALKREGFVKSEAGRVPGQMLYTTRRDNEKFRLYKKLDMVSEIYESGLLEALDRLSPDCIVLFGSASKGEDIAGSDIDIFVQCKKKEILISKFEKKLGRKISLFFEPEFRKLSKELRSSIANGVILKGYLNVV